MTRRGAVNGTVFRRFVRTCLTPFIRPGDLVVMDNLNMHKSPSTKRRIEAAGGVPIHLPTYSPELNPIELLWAHLKRELRRLAIDSEPELRAASGPAPSKARPQVPHRGLVPAGVRHSPSIQPISVFV